MSNRFILDAETDGLYGNILTVAVAVTDYNGGVIELFYGGVQSAIESVRDPWVLENVVPRIRDYTPFDSEYDLLEAVWSLWEKYRDSATCYVDVPFPVESGLLTKVVSHDLDNRKFSAPFPLIDLASMLLAKGIDPDTSRSELADSNLEQHNALDDVLMTNSILTQLGV